MRNAAPVPDVVCAFALLVLMLGGGAGAQGIDKQDFKQIERGRYVVRVSTYGSGRRRGPYTIVAR